MINILVIFLLIINQSVKVKSECDGCSSSKTYGLTSDLKLNCVSNCSHQLVISIKNIDKNNVKDKELHITITGKNVESSANYHLRTIIEVGSVKNIYSCDKYSDGNSVSRPKGKASYFSTNKTLTCHWIISKSQNNSWPLDGIKKADLMTNVNYKIAYEVGGSKGDQNIIVDSKPMELTVYSDLYLKCCGSRTFGDSNYALYMLDNGTAGYFVFRYQNATLKMARNELSFQPSNLAFDCNFVSKSVSGFIGRNGSYSPLATRNFVDNKIIENICHWRLVQIKQVAPSSGGSSVQIDLKQLKDLKIIADGKTVFPKAPTTYNPSSTQNPGTEPSLVKSGVAFTNPSLTSILISFIIFQFSLLLSNKI